MKQRGILKLVLSAAAVAFLATGLSAAGNNCAEPSKDVQGDGDSAVITNSTRSQGWLGIEKRLNEDKRIVVSHVTPQSPADIAGFRVGDVIEWIDGIPLSPESADQTFSNLGRPGETLTYGIQRGPDHLILFAELVRAPDRDRASLRENSPQQNRAN